jgi:hypothetical protein
MHMSRSLNAAILCHAIVRRNRILTSRLWQLMPRAVYFGAGALSLKRGCRSCVDAKGTPHGAVRELAVAGGTCLDKGRGDLPRRDAPCAAGFLLLSTTSPTQPRAATPASGGLPYGCAGAFVRSSRHVPLEIRRVGRQLGPFVADGVLECLIPVEYVYPFALATPTKYSRCFSSRSWPFFRAHSLTARAISKSAGMGPFFAVVVFIFFSSSPLPFLTSPLTEFFRWNYDGIPGSDEWLSVDLPVLRARSTMRVLPCLSFLARESLAFSDITR